MDVYHEDFRDSIALDLRIKAISEALGLSFSSYTEHERFYLDVAREAGLNGWELDRCSSTSGLKWSSGLAFRESPRRCPRAGSDNLARPHRLAWGRLS